MIKSIEYGHWSKAVLKYYNVYILNWRKEYINNVFLKVYKKK